MIRPLWGTVFSFVVNEQWHLKSLRIIWILEKMYSMNRHLSTQITETHLNHTCYVLVTGWESVYILSNRVKNKTTCTLTMWIILSEITGSYVSLAAVIPFSVYTSHKIILVRMKQCPRSFSTYGRAMKMLFTEYLLQWSLIIGVRWSFFWSIRVVSSILPQQEWEHLFSNSQWKSSCLERKEYGC